MLRRGDVTPAGVTMPRAISEVRPVYPKEQYDGRRDGTVWFEAEVTEHGTLVNIRRLEPADASNDFKLASQLAVSLWRFEPATAGGCPARTISTFEMSFRLR